MIATSAEPNDDRMKVLNVNGIRVHVFPSGQIKIYAKNKGAAEKVMKYINDEALLDGLFDSSIFKNKRNPEHE